MKGLHTMIFDENGAIEVFQTYLNEKLMMSGRVKVRRVRMTRSKKFIVETFDKPKSQIDTMEVKNFLDSISVHSKEKSL